MPYFGTCCFFVFCALYCAIVSHLLRRKRENNNVKAEILFNLAKRCSVSMHAACVKTDVAYSTTHRWKRGSEPKPETFDKLHHAILQIADEKGTLPEDLRKDLEVKS